VERIAAIDSMKAPNPRWEWGFDSGRYANLNQLRLGDGRNLDRRTCWQERGGCDGTEHRSANGHQHCAVDARDEGAPSRMNQKAANGAGCVLAHRDRRAHRSLGLAPWA
jgi:hypothetical protein